MEEILKKQGNEKICTSAIFVRGGKVLLGLRHYKEASIWTTPGGRSDHNENIEESLRREVLEETGISDMTIVGYLGTVESERHTGDSVAVFLCVTKESCTLAEPDKFSEWKWYKKGDVPANFINKNVLKLIPF